MADSDNGPEIRPEVVGAVFQALTSGDLAALATLEAGNGTITPAEHAAAENLYLATAPSDLDHRLRKVRAITLLAGPGGLTGNPTWADLFDRFSADRLPELTALYDGLPDGARAEYDRRYGLPNLSGEGD